MRPDDFEQKLQRQPLRQIPGEWRAAILREAGAAVGTGRCAVRGRRSAASLPDWISSLLWPHPKAWAGLAAVWILILAVDFSMRDKTPVLAEKSVPPSPEVVAELKQQQRMLAELIGSSQARDAEPPKFLPLPRSERVEILMT